MVRRIGGQRLRGIQQRRLAIVVGDQPLPHWEAIGGCEFYAEPRFKNGGLPTHLPAVPCNT